MLVTGSLGPFDGVGAIVAPMRAETGKRNVGGFGLRRCSETKVPVLCRGFRRCADASAREHRPHAETSGRTAPKAHAKLSFSMEGVFERVMPGEGY